MMRFFGAVTRIAIVFLTLSFAARSHATDLLGTTAGELGMY